jgi:hypothetical protein
MDSRARHARELQRAIGDLLLRHWDPLGVADVPEGEGQYDAYVGPVYRLLADGASDREIAEHLVRVETEALGFEDSHWRLLVPTAHKLRKLYVRLTATPPAP